MSEQPSTLRVLVAEDNALERSTLVDLLGVLGHVVVAEVESGTDAIAKAQQFTPDAVLLDITCRAPQVFRPRKKSPVRCPARRWC